MGQEDIKKLKKTEWSATYKAHLKQWLKEPDHTGRPNIELLYDKELIEELKNYK